MKLSITQAVLGALIVLAAVFIARWMIFGVTSLLDMTVLDENGVMVANASPERQDLFTVARYSFPLLLGLGLVVSIRGASWERTENRKELAITQIIAGALIIAVSVFILRWGYALEFVIPIEGGPVLEMAYARNVTLLTALLGLAVTGVGIAQLVKTRKQGGN
jgi:hypothetical protein